MIHLIGLSGRRGSGKDTVARILQQLQPERNWQIRSFGDSIKSVCAALTGEDVAPYYTQRGKAELVPTFHRTRGEMLQQVGSALRAWEPLVWVDAFFAGLPGDAFVLVPDVRFANEADPIRARSGLMLRVEGDPLHQRGDGTRDDNHPSETAMDDYPHFDFVLHNTGSREDLTRQVRELLERL
jgi:energy-coupling factor transporter ATP-binding protein EcfA2